MKTNYIICILAAVTTSIVVAQDGAPTDPAAEAVRLSNNGQHAESIECLQNALLGDPGNENLKFRLAGELVFDHRSNEARACLQELSRSWNADMASMAATSLSALDRFEEEEKKARAHPSTPEVLRQQAEYRVRKERLDRQQKVFELIQAKRDDEAVLQIDELQILGEANTAMLLEKSYAFARLARNDEAVNVLQGIPAEDDPDGQVRLALAGLLSRDGRTTEAVKIWRDIRNSGGDSAASRTAAQEMSVLAPAYNTDCWSWGELDLYGTYLSRYKIGVAAGRIREGTFVPGARWIEPFIQGDFSLDSSSSAAQGISTIYNENLAGFHAGVRVRPFAAQSFVLYVLGGAQKDLRGTTQRHAKWFSELIAGVNGYWAWGPGKEWAASDLEAESPGGMGSLNEGKVFNSWSPRGWLPVRGRFDWFVEAGGDAAYYTRLPDGIAYLQSRQGIRFLQCGKAAALDAYGLQNLTMDTRGNYYDNYFEAGPGVRLITSPVGAAVFTTSVDYLLGSYLGRNFANSRGDTGATYSDFRITAALSLRW
jgi:thioredoxin-like negative regulator of GroEL